MRSLCVLLVDDEAPALAALRSLLEREPGITIVGECRNGLEAVDAIPRHAPDVVFLDIEMPGLNGFEVLEQLDTEQVPAVVFVTAYSQYAVDAFRVQALDYLLKPFDSERVQETLVRVRERLAAGPPSGETLLRALQDLASNHRPLERLAVRDGDDTLIIRATDVRWFESEQNYVRLHVGPRSYLARTSLRSLEDRLDATRFVRIHRTTIVNADRVRKLRSIGHGDQRVVLDDETVLTLSRRYKDRLEQALARLG